MRSSHDFIDYGTNKVQCVDCGAEYELATDFINYDGFCGRGQLLTATEERTQRIFRGLSKPLMGLAS